MSNYRNFIKDFPNRCIQLLNLHHAAAQADLEITLLMAVAAQAITMPIERLKPGHLFGDAKTFERAKSKLDKVLDTECRNSPIFQRDDGMFDRDDWKFKQCRLDEIKSETLDSVTSIGAERCRMIITLLRNALAHGNLRTDGNPIDRLVFISYVSVREPDKGFRRIECAPRTFQRFLKAWVNEIQNLDLQREEIVE